MDRRVFLSAVTVASSPRRSPPRRSRRPVSQEQRARRWPSSGVLWETGALKVLFSLVLLTVGLAAHGCAKSPEEARRAAAIEASKRTFVLSDDKQLRPLVEAKIRDVMGTQGWKWTSQEPGELIPTRNPAAPFVSTTIVWFENPTDANVRRVLRWTWIYDGGTWEPLALSLWDWDTKAMKPKAIIREWTVWGGERRK